MLIKEIRFTNLSLAIGGDDTLYVYDNAVLVYTFPNQSNYNIIDTRGMDDWEEDYHALLVYEL